MDFDRYPCLRMAFDSGKAGGSMTAVFNAANEVAVSRFVAGEIGFLDIENVIESVIDRHEAVAAPSIEQIDEADGWARELAGKYGK
jgi:1-deoxy-D-xylulose-5-phosphate reductoisomerase